jgi:hypothetical protein
MISVPVYSDENGIPQISIYVEDEDGTFRRTQSEPLRLLRDDIQGISITQGDMVSSAYDRQERNWQTPTVTFHYGRPQSFYQFLRDKVAHNRFFVFTKPQLAGHISKFSLHELKLKNSTSQRKVAILKEKYIEALQIWQEQELLALHAKAENVKAKIDLKTANQSTVRENIDNNKSGKASAGGKQPLPQRTTPPHHDNVHHFRRADVQEHKIRASVADGASTSQSIEQGTRRRGKQRKNLVQDFSLSKPRQRVAAKPKEHNKHFYNRFIFTID